MKAHEKRGAPRVPYISEVVCESDGNRLTARTSDISASGVFIHSKLWCEAGSILTLNFAVSSTRIETAGEVCYSIPHIGMGIRFLDLKPEYLDAIERLIESQQDQECNEIKTKALRLIPSGVEPVDKHLGGLERGHLYLARGDASGKSLVGIAFLIEGLKRGQPGALITTQRREDAIRRFARLGYDCSRAMLTGALVVFTYSNDIVEHYLHLEPLLSEFGPILDKTSPERIVFDPVDNLLAGVKQDDVLIRANQLSVWVRSFGATVVLVANEDKRGVIESLTPSVRDSFRFEVRESCDRVVRMLVFEKSPSIPDQAVRVDPSRGIFLLEDQHTGELMNERLEKNDEEAATSGSETARVENDESEEHQAYSQRVTDPLPDPRSVMSNVTDQDWTVSLSDPRVAGHSMAPTPGLSVNKDLTSQPTTGDLNLAVAQGEACDAFFAMLDELQSFVSEIDPDVADAPDADPPDTMKGRLPESGGVRLQPQ